MLKRTVFAGLLALTTAVPALAHGGYYDDWVDARVIRVEPYLSFSYSNWGGDDAFRILYEWGGRQYWTHAPRHPGNWVRVRPPRVAYFSHAPRYRHDRHHDHRHDWRHDRRHDDRNDWRHDRGHDDDRRGDGRHGDRRW